MINARESKANVLLSLLIILYKSVRLYINGNYEYHLFDKVDILLRETFLRICVMPANRHMVSTVMAHYVFVICVTLLCNNSASQSKKTSIFVYPLGQLLRNVLYENNISDHK